MKIKTTLGIFLIFSLVLILGCGQDNKAAQENEPLILRSYAVPEGMAKEVSETINELLGWNERRGRSDVNLPPIGKARVSPDGQLLVAAPESFHNGVYNFIEHLQKVNPEPSPSAEVNYWIVAGRKANKPAILDDFKTIKPALETIQNSQGNMEFKLIDHSALASSGQGTETRLESTLFFIRQTLSAYSDGSLEIYSSIAYNLLLPNGDHRNYSIDTRIETKSGELVVLGQASQQFNMPIFTPAEEGKPHYETVSVYYIISATVKK